MSNFEIENDEVELDKEEEESADKQQVEPAHYRNRLGQVIETRHISKKSTETRQND